MARGVFALGKTQEEAERQVRDGAPQMRILRSRRISLAGLPPLPASGPLENPWVVAVEHTDPAEEANLPQDEDPEHEVERSTRELYLTSPPIRKHSSLASAREHAIPAWVSKRLGIRDELSAEDAFIAGGARRRKQPISFTSHRAPVMCKPCNRHFKHLEDRVIPLLVPMAEGKTLALARDSQALLVLLANETTIGLLAAEDATAVPMADGPTIRNEARAAEDTWVAFFPWRGGPLVSTEHTVRRDHSIRRSGLLRSSPGLRRGCVVRDRLRRAASAGMVLTGDPPPLRRSSGRRGIG